MIGQLQKFRHRGGGRRGKRRLPCGFGRGRGDKLHVRPENVLRAGEGDGGLVRGTVVGFQHAADHPLKAHLGIGEDEKVAFLKRFQRAFALQGKGAQGVAARPQLPAEDARGKVGNGVGQMLEGDFYGVDPAPLHVDVGKVLLRDAGRFLARVRQLRVFERDLVDEGVEADGGHVRQGGEVPRADDRKARRVVAAAQQAQAYPARGPVAGADAVDAVKKPLYVGFRLVGAAPDRGKAEVLGIEDVRGLPEARVVKVVRRVLPAEIGIDQRVADFMGRVDLRARDDRLGRIPVIGRMPDKAAERAKLRGEARHVALVHAERHKAPMGVDILPEVLAHDAVGKLRGRAHADDERTFQPSRAAGAVAAEKVRPVDRDLLIRRLPFPRHAIPVDDLEQLVGFQAKPEDGGHEVVVADDLFFLFGTSHHASSRRARSRAFFAVSMPMCCPVATSSSAVTRPAMSAERSIPVRWQKRRMPSAQCRWSPCRMSSGRTKTLAEPLIA